MTHPPATPALSSRGPRALIAAALLVACAAAGLGVPTAHAQRGSRPATGNPENADASRQAREHFVRGQQHFDAREFAEAVESFEAAAALVPSADLWYNIARAHEELRHFDQAVDYYRRYLRDRVDPPDRARIEQHITELEAEAEAQRLAAHAAPTTGTLTVSVAQDGASVSVDSAPVGTSPLSEPLTLEPGLHALSVDLDGYVPFRSEVRLSAGLGTLATIDLQPLTQFRSVRGRRIYTWIVGALAVAAAGTSLGLGIRAQRLENQGRLADARDFARYSDIALGSGIVLGIGSITLYFVEGRAISTERVSGPTPSGDED
ncbi:MAG: PEGA domain-containing protein [Polyangiales bacterium]|nr:PEGA domain-containing protein [Myxococcales bacterium]MCB9658587.1 PEGA domain-containing protein [Sandaracinaceae bacterium]